MRDLLILVVHFATMVIRLARPGGLRAVVAESPVALPLIEKPLLRKSTFCVKPDCSR